MKASNKMYHQETYHESDKLLEIISKCENCEKNHLARVQKISTENNKLKLQLLCLNEQCLFVYSVII